MNIHQIEAQQSADRLIVNLTVCLLLLAGLFFWDGIIGSQVAFHQLQGQAFLKQPLSATPAIYRISLSQVEEGLLDDQDMIADHGGMLKVEKPVLKQFHSFESRGHELESAEWRDRFDWSDRTTHRIRGRFDTYTQCFGDRQVSGLHGVKYPSFGRCMHASLERKIHTDHNNGQAKWLHLNGPFLNPSSSLRI